MVAIKIERLRALLFAVVVIAVTLAPSTGATAAALRRQVGTTT